MVVENFMFQNSLNILIRKTKNCLGDLSSYIEISEVLRDIRRVYCQKTSETMKINLKFNLIGLEN